MDNYVWTTGVRARPRARFGRPGGDLYDEIRPLLLMLKALGALPVDRLDNGKVVLRVVSWSMLYSVVVYVAVLTMLWLSEGVRVMFVADTRGQNEAIKEGFIAMVKFLLVLTIPFCNWREARAVAEYVVQWRSFQEDYLSKTGLPLRLSFRRRQLLCMASLVAADLLLEGAYLWLWSESTVLDYLLLFYRLLLRDSLALLWHFLCRALVEAARTMRRHLLMELRASSLARYGRLWLQLSTLTRHLGTACCHVYGFYLVHLFVSHTLAVYSIVASLIYGSGLVFVPRAVQALKAGALLYLACDSANDACVTVGDAFQEELLTVRVRAEAADVHEEVGAFLQAVRAYRPTVTLGDYVVVDRTLLVSFGSLLVTYLVVLFQFKISEVH